MSRKLKWLMSVWRRSRDCIRDWRATCEIETSYQECEWRLWQALVLLSVMIYNLEIHSLTRGMITKLERWRRHLFVKLQGSRHMWLTCRTTLFGESTRRSQSDRSCYADDFRSGKKKKNKKKYSDHAFCTTDDTTLLSCLVWFARDGSPLRR